ncbi:PREDICTED: probable histone H2B.1 [Erythranthe guttata]|uniref:probable histone H2B.1 n=1 Tax=Erythranthe guttata TaxID=4155 RepID=UPI00064DF548|nr:PREDICTED: probable histone H2B.1 [Erythranthe guttata]|eukprot:XP_012837510.1 PREDICTED: probable histone H2B.1 [Erythranthe guttata]
MVVSKKKPKAGKKLPKDAGKAAIGGEKKKRTKKNVKTNKIYIFKVSVFEQLLCTKFLSRNMVFVKLNYYFFVTGLGV